MKPISSAYLLAYGLLGVLLLFFPASVAQAQQNIELSSTLNPVGSGARATGMGGAFIGVADDATAASWNPAGLVQLEKPEISAVYSYFNRTQKYSAPDHPELNSENTMDTSGLNYASAAYPFVLFKRNVVVSLNYQRLYELRKKLNFDFTFPPPADNSFPAINSDVNFTQSGYLYAFSPAAAVQVSPKLYVGATLNFWGDYFGNNGWVLKQKFNGRATDPLFGPMLFRQDQKIEHTFKGINANFGFLWMFHDKFTLGGVFKTPFDAKLKKNITITDSIDIPDFMFHDESLTTKTEHFTMKMPSSYGFGLSYRHSDNWTVAVDIYRTTWSQFMLRDSEGKETNPINGKPIIDGRLKDTTQVRLGTEYLFIKENYVIPARFGLFYDPEPQTKSLDDFYGFSVGTGYSRGKVALDASYQFRYGRDITGDIGGTTMDTNQHTLMMSMIFYF